MELKWPLRSPNLNPIECLWIELGHQLGAKAYPKVLPDLKHTLTHAKEVEAIIG